MPDAPSKTNQGQTRADWNPARPEKLPEPSLWPPALALGVTLSLWGLASSWIISAVGLLLFAYALTYWIGEIRHERRKE
jgi:hypothetical protein